ncbi:hypothetical protein [Streptosporangium saharense]|uniref:Orc1-like AAA ATPase domain-containing protein n=1 Tax=Streptosporangium saharense TaxID=1706840 RepID=A0A7W7QL36_9ACTN|nr:hypothetical protein [Streptosporangium saharense]MBB4915379.1 hypothetical protein [Streptosporangium saharense]
MNPAELGAELERHAAAWRAEQFGRFDPAGLAKLALLPEWTTELAVRLSLAPEEELTGFLDALDDLGLVESRTLPTGQEAFWVRASRRAELGAHLRQTHGRLLDEVAGELLSLTWGVAELRDWWRAATVHREGHSGATLMADVSALVEEGKVSEAAQLVATTRMLGEVLGEPLVGAARRARRRVDRAAREAEDARFLRHYLPRADIEAALAELLGADPPRWALHLLGAGGAGKTMVVRHLASGRYARDRGLNPVPVARVDFDHLDPRYPQDRPGEILLALGEELLGFGTGRDAEHAHRRFADSVVGLHEELSRGRLLSGRATPLLDHVVESFARFVRLLPGPVVLVLDTCEELAKLYPPGAPAPAIDMTFGLLERLRERAPSIRVLLAGRRWLARPYGTAEESEVSAGPLLLPRPYLRVLRTHGFTAAEADGYLAARAVPRRLRAAVLTRSANGDVFNPFDLAAYAEWALSEPGLDPVRLLRAEGDPYVEHRIIGRLADQGVTRALAVAAELGRFDRAQISPALLRLGLDPDAVFDGLAAQEWTRVTETGQDGRPWVVELEEQVRVRLRRVTAADPGRFPLRADLLGRDAAAVADATPVLSEVSAATVVAAVRLLPVEEAAEFWRGIESRAAAQDAWPWAEQVAVRAAAEEALRAGESGPSILAAILATQAAARTHTGTGGVEELWRRVAVHAPRHPGPAQAVALADRALLGQAAAGSVPLDDLLPGVVARGAAPEGSVVAAIDGWMRHGDWSRLRDEDLRRVGGDLDLTGEEHPTIKESLVLPSITGQGPVPADVAPSPDGSWLAVLYGDGAVRLTHDGTTTTLDGHGATGVTVSPDGAWVVTTARDGMLRAFRPDGTLCAIAPSGTSAPRGVTYAGDGRSLACVGWEGKAVVWETDGERPFVRLRAVVWVSTPVAGVALSEDGSRLFTRGSDGSTRMWNTDRRIATAVTAQRALLALHRREHGDHGAYEIAERLAADAFVSALPVSARPAVRDTEWEDATGLHLELVATVSPDDVPATAWADWRAPRRLDARCLLVWQLVTTGWRERDDFQTPWQSFSAPFDDIDVERLLAWRVRVHNGRRPLEPHVLELLADRDTYSPARRASVWQHHRIRPLVVEVAEAWLTRGEVMRAVELLRGRIEAAVASGDDPDTVEQCQLALIRICRRVRSLVPYPELTSLTTSGTPLVRAEAWITLTLVTGARPSSPEEAGSWYGWWQCQDRRSLAGGQPGWEPPSAPEPGIPRGLTLAARGEHTGHPEDSIALPRFPMLFPGPGGEGRQLLERAETIALRSPAFAWAVFDVAAGLLEEAHDPRDALQARILALLARVRVGPPPRRPSIKKFDALPLDQVDFPPGSGWPERIAYLRGLLEDAEATGSDLPELALDSAVPSPPPPEASPPTFAFGRFGGAVRGVTVAALLALALMVGLLPVADQLPSLLRVVFGLVPFATVLVLVLPSGWERSVPADMLGFLDRLIPRMLVTAVISAESDRARIATVGRRSPRNWRLNWTDISRTTQRGQLITWEFPRLPADRLRPLVRLELPGPLDGEPWESRLPLHARVFRGAVAPPIRPPVQERNEHGQVIRRTSFSMLHVTGTAVTTAAGTRIRLSGDFGGSRSGLLDPASMEAATRTLVILQANPVDGPPVPLAEQRGLFAALARELVAMGTRAVLVIPPLPDTVAEQASSLARSKASKHGASLLPRHLLRLQRDLRSLVRKAGGEREAVCDVLLFLPTTFREDTSG